MRGRCLSTRTLAYYVESYWGKTHTGSFMVSDSQLSDSCPHLHTSCILKTVWHCQKIWWQPVQNVLWRSMHEREEGGEEEEEEKKSRRVTGHRKLAGCTNLFHAALACVGGGFILLESNLVLMFTLSAKSYDYVESFILIPLTNSFLIQV